MDQADKIRRTITFDKDVNDGIQRYRANFLNEGNECSYTETVNVLLRFELAKHGLIKEANRK